jgi:tetratricopeptide (TPR) repeat protein
MRARNPWLAVAGCAALCCCLSLAALLAHADLERQIADMTARIDKDPSNPELYLRRGELHRIHRDWDAAMADYRRARKVSPDPEVVDYFFGKLHLDAGRPKRAKKSLDRFLKHEPTHARALVTRARALVQLDRPLDAAEDFSRAIDAYDADERPDPSYYLERAHALVDAGPDRIEAALAGLDEGLARLGRPVTLQIYAIDLEVERGNTDGALARLEQIASQSERQETWLVRRGEILEGAGRAREARAAFARAIEAIEALPASRRGSRAMLRLRAEAEGALVRLEGS